MVWHLSEVDDPAKDPEGGQQAVCYGEHEDGMYLQRTYTLYFIFCVTVLICVYGV